MKQFSESIILHQRLCNRDSYGVLPGKIAVTLDPNWSGHRVTDDLDLAGPWSLLLMRLVVRFDRDDLPPACLPAQRRRWGLAECCLKNVTVLDLDSSSGAGGALFFLYFIAQPPPVTG